MINRVNDGDTLEDVKIKLNEIIDVLVFDNPSDRIEEVAEKHLSSHNAEISKIRTNIIATLESAKEQVIINQELKSDIQNFKRDIEKEFTSFKTEINKELSKLKTEINKELSEFKKDIKNNTQEFILEQKNISTSVEDKMKQFITFYAQVGLHIKEICDGKK